MGATTSTSRHKPFAKTNEANTHTWFHPYALSNYAGTINGYRYSEKFCDNDGRDYRGLMNWSKSGSVCQPWNLKHPHPHTFSPSNPKYTAALTQKQSDTDPKQMIGTGGHNYCRWLPNTGHLGTSKKDNPFCFGMTDRYGTSWDQGHPATNSGVYDGTSEYQTGWTSGKKSYDILNDFGGDITRHSDAFGAQRCWAGQPQYDRWDCHDAETIAASSGTNTHGIISTEHKMNGGSKEHIKQIITSGSHEIAEDCINNSTPWIAKSRGKSMNTQEHWIRIDLLNLIDIYEIWIADASSSDKKISTTATPFILNTYNSHPVENDLEVVDSSYSYKRLLYGGENYSENILTFGSGGVISKKIIKPVKTILLEFKRSLGTKFYDGFGISNIVIKRIYHNYEVNYDKINETFFLFDYSGYTQKLVTNSRPNIIKYSNSYGINFTHSSHYKIENVLPINRKENFYENHNTNDYQKVQPTGAKPINTVLNDTPVIMIGCWFKKPFVDTNSAHVLISNTSGSFQPIVINKDQNKFGAIVTDATTADADGFIDSNIRIGELKNGWHHLLVYITKANIYYYINGVKEGGDTSGVIDMSSASNPLDDIHIIGNSNSLTNPWGIISNLNIYCNWCKRHDMVDSQSNNKSVNASTAAMTTASTAEMINLPDVIKADVEVRYGAAAGGSGVDIDWKKNTCPNHTSVIKKAVNTAKATTIVANTHKLKKKQKEFENNIRESVQQAENEAYYNIINFVSNSQNVIIWNNVNTWGKQIKLVSEYKNTATGERSTTDIGISNIQVYGEVDNVEKDWIQDKDTEVDLSSQPSIDTDPVELSYIKTYTGAKSTGDKGADSFAKCPANEYLTGCKCWSTDLSCAGAEIVVDDTNTKKYQCKATNKLFGTGVYAKATCAKFTGLTTGNPEGDFIMREPEASIAGADPDTEIKCNIPGEPGEPGEPDSRYYMIGCTCHSTDRACDGAEMTIAGGDENDSKTTATCKVHKNMSSGGNDIRPQAMCLHIPGEKDMANVSHKIVKSSKISGTDTNDPISAKCPLGYNLLDGDCMSGFAGEPGKAAQGNCNGSKNFFNKNEVVAYNREYGTGVKAIANCMKFNIIDDNCIDGSIETQCRTGNAQEAPWITFTFPKLVKIKKIVIYNRKEDKSNNLPLHINIIDNHDHIIMTGVKKDYNSPIKTINMPPAPPAGCKGFSSLNITDKGWAIRSDGKPEFRQWADIRGVGKKCDYCRMVGKKDKRMLSCALGNNSYNQYAYNSVVDVNTLSPGDPPPIELVADTAYMFPESNDTKDDYCYLKTDTTNNKSSLECRKNTDTGFGEKFIPGDQDSNYMGLNGQQILQYRKPFDTSRCNLNSRHESYLNNSVDAGFYWPTVGKYFIFKNSILDSNKVILFREYDVQTDKNTNNSPNSPLLLNNNNWPNLVLNDKIDAVLYLPIDIKNGTSVEHLYFFSKNTCIQFDLTDNSGKGTVINQNQNTTTIEDYFSEIVDQGFKEIDSACYLGNNEILFIKGSQFIKYTINAVEPNKPNSASTPLYLASSDTFQKLPFTSGIDCLICFYNVDEPKRPILMFKNEQCIDIEYNGSSITKRCESSQSVITADAIINKYPKIWDIDIDIAFGETRTRLSDKTKIDPDTTTLTRSPCITDPTIDTTVSTDSTCSQKRTK